MNLIRTGLRDKLPRELAYPVGGERISDALAGVPQFEWLWIAFNHHPWPALRHGVPPPSAADFKVVLRVVFNQKSRPHQNSWSLTVHAVPREFQSKARDLLVQVGLPEVRRWLLMPRAETWYDNSMRQFEVAVSVKEARVWLVEMRNDQVVSAKGSGGR